MPVTEFVRSTAAEGKAKDLEEAFTTSIPGFLDQPGCLSAKAFRGVKSEDPEVFYLVIEWNSIEEHNAWRESEGQHRQWFVENIRPLLGGANLSGHFDEFVGG
jgi:heme-degrading monooxygenase HmoA